jgi:elongation factor 1-beta
LGDVAIIYRVMPEGVEVNLNDVKSKIAELCPEEAKIEGFMIKDVAFGIQALLFRVIIPDKVGGGIPDKIEEIVSSIEGVASIEAIEQSLVS